MNNKILILLLISSSILLNSCKKGDDDPFLSLKSRNSRLIGTWELSSAKYQYVETTGGVIDTRKYDYESGNMTRLTSSGTDTYKYNEQLTVNKDGTYAYVYTYETSSISVLGRWMWANKNEDLDLKNKEAIVLTETTNPDVTYTGQTTPPQVLLVLKRLAKDEMTIVYDQTYTITESEFKKSKSGEKTYTKN